jgi:predicted transcriptional regulator
MDEIKELTKAEEQIMQELWDMGGGFVKEVIDRLPKPKPAYNTVSTIVRILETKGFVVHEAFGKSHRYIPKVQKEDYKKVVAGKLLNGYFDNSPKRMLSFFLEENKLDIKELNDILDLINKNK